MFSSLGNVPSFHYVSSKSFQNVWTGENISFLVEVRKREISYVTVGVIGLSFKQMKTNVIYNDLNDLSVC